MSTPTNRATGLGIRLLFGLLMAFTAVGVAQAPATAATRTAVQAQHAEVQAAAAQQAAMARSAQAVWSCNWSRSGNNVDSYCSVSSGYLRQWAYCSGWGYIYSPWVGVGSYHLWTHCNSYQLTSWGYQTLG